jgi:hypothetical protein
MKPHERCNGETVGQRNYRSVKERMATDPAFRAKYLADRRKISARQRRRAIRSPDARAKHLAQNRQRVYAIIAEKKKMISDAKGDTCSKCGKRLAKNQLHWHHRDPATKLFCLANGHERSREAIRLEIAKCEPVCQRCHTAIHHPPAATVADDLRTARGNLLGGMDVEVDPKALSMPNGVECPLVDRRSDWNWCESPDAHFREWCFNTLYATAYESVKDPTIRFGLALAASCRQPIRPHLIPRDIPRKISHSVKHACEPRAESLGTPVPEAVDGASAAA